MLPEGGNLRLPGMHRALFHDLDANTACQERRGDLHVMRLDLANAYGSMAHKFIEFFHTPSRVTNIIAKYFNLHMCFSQEGLMTGWQQLEVGIAMGCSISPILFVAMFEMILIGARQVVRGLKLPSVDILPPLRSYMDVAQASYRQPHAHQGSSRALTSWWWHERGWRSSPQSQGASPSAKEWETTVLCLLQEERKFWGWHNNLSEASEGSTHQSSLTDRWGGQHRSSWQMDW